MSVAVALIPVCPHIWGLYLCQFFNGLGAGAWDNGNNVWLVELWPQQSSPILQFSHFMYGLGSVLAPILVRPYLTGENSTHHNSSGLLLNEGLVSQDSGAVDRRQLLKTPFLISGVLQAIGKLLVQI